MKTIWSFAVGKASIGEAVRNRADHSFPHKAVLLIPHDFAETKTAATRRRKWRTRQAHRAREKWLDHVMRKAAGIKPLVGRQVVRDAKGSWQTIPGDERLEREFPAAGDSTCYTSCLLRIKLLRGEKLEPWQIYKALRSAMQHRGYDPDVPWKATKSRLQIDRLKDGEEKGLLDRMQQFVRNMERMAPRKPRFHFPCYFDAWKMGLWNPNKPKTLKLRIDCAAKSTRNQVMPRRLVEKEIRALVAAAAKQIPALENQAGYLLYGPAGKAYASRYPALRRAYGLHEGSTDDWQGALGQKVPRFDNRFIGKCVLIPRMNVCKIRSDEKGRPLPQSRLAVEVDFLMKLKNARVQRSGSGESSLTANELRTIFAEQESKSFKITEAQWRKFCPRIDAVPLLGYEKIEELRSSGRGCFCRPALEILKQLILSGQDLPSFRRSELKRLKGNTNPNHGLVPGDLSFLAHMGANWDAMWIPDEKLDSLLRRATDRNAAIRQLVGNQTDPIVRHRLGVFCERLAELQRRFGAPDKIVLEFARADFMAKKTRLDYRALLRERTPSDGFADGDAIYLDDHYHALADTAWIARLYRAAIALHFGWRRGIDNLKRPAVTVVPEVLTDSVRQGFNLNSLLVLPTPRKDATGKRNPGDRRHHALEAMVINFLAGWTGNAETQPHFPDSVHRNAMEFFANEIADIKPEQFAYEKATLAEAIYGARRENGETKIVQRVPLHGLAFKPIGIGKTNFDLKYLINQIARIRDRRITSKLIALIASGLDEQRWNKFCAGFRLNRGNSPLIRRVLIEVGNSTEYQEMMKSPGAFRRGANGHKGQIVYLETVIDKQGRPRETVQVRPIYAFESTREVQRELIEQHGDQIRIYGVFQTGCQIAVDREVRHERKPLPPGIYRLNSIRTGTKDVKVTTATGETNPSIPLYRLANMIKAGLRRIV